MKNAEKDDKQSTTTEKGKQPTVQNNPDDKRVPTVTPDNDSGEPGAPSQPKAGKK